MGSFEQLTPPDLTDLSGAEKKIGLPGRLVINCFSREFFERVLREGPRKVLRMGTCTCESMVVHVICFKTQARKKWAETKARKDRQNKNTSIKIHVSREFLVFTLGSSIFPALRSPFRVCVFSPKKS